ncbi:hypothetical protein Tco_1016012, partial [Tanacetum coccineum]
MGRMIAPIVAGALIGIHKADGKNDSPNVNHNAVNKGLSCSANDPMVPTCSSPDMDNGEVVVAGIGIHKADGQNDIPNANHNAVNQGICGSANDHMLDVLIQVACDGMGIDKADGNNDYTYSQREPSTLDVLGQYVVDGNVRHCIERHQKHNATLLLCSAYCPSMSGPERECRCLCSNQMCDVLHFNRIWVAWEAHTVYISNHKMMGYLQEKLLLRTTVVVPKRPDCSPYSYMQKMTLAKAYQSLAFNSTFKVNHLQSRATEKGQRQLQIPTTNSNIEASS